VERKKEILGREERSKKHWSREKPELKRNERRRDVNGNEKEEVVKETVNKLHFFPHGKPTLRSSSTASEWRHEIDRDRSPTVCQSVVFPQSTHCLRAKVELISRP
jgi:hypothetical protein